MIPRFEMPWVLLALLVLPWLVRRLRRAVAPALALPAPGWSGGLPESPRTRRAHLPRQLRVAALALLIFAAAGPRLGPRVLRRPEQTIGLQLVVDCSGSMNESDMTLEGKQWKRIDLVRELSRQFLLGAGGDLPGRPLDTIGVIAFAEYPTTLRPLVFGNENLSTVLDAIRVGEGSQSTAIGDAVAVAAARFRQAEANPQQRFRSKAIVLLTDGDNNSGRHSMGQAAEIARQWGVRVYVIAIRDKSVARVKAADSAWDVLEQLAASTGGIARPVSDGSSLREVYAEIDRLEKSERAAPRFSGGWEWTYVAGFAGMGLLLTEITLRQTWLRRLP